MTLSWQQELDKEREAPRDGDIQKEENPKGNRYPLEEQGVPRMEMAVTIRLLRGKIIALGTGSRSCMPIARGVGGKQTWKMSKTLPEQDCSFPDFTQKCANYVNF